MNHRILSAVLLSFLSIILLTGCVTGSAQEALTLEKSQTAIRSIQSRAFNTTDRHKMMRTIIATLQDLSFVIDKADKELGTVSATKLDGYQLRMTVSVRPRGNKQTLVRANAQYMLTPVEDPLPYQQFFSALEKAIFLTAHQVD